MLQRNRLLFAYALLVLASLFLLTRLRFTFDFDQFFPQGDPDWEFFKNYIKEFESDDNFLLVAVERREGVFDSTFLQNLHDFSLKAAELPHITSVQSLTKMQYPLQTPFGITAVPVIHLDQPEFYASDRQKVLQDPRFVHNLISSDGTAMTVLLKTVERSTLDQATAIMDSLETLLKPYRQTGVFDEVHVLGRAYFQKEMVRMEVREVLVSTVIAAILATLVLFFIFRRWWSVFISMAGIGLALLFFMGLLSALGRELNALSALYPILMCIVGVADSIHIISKYLDELEKGHDQQQAIRTTLREIGLATFMTCVTTAIGFASLVTNRTAPIQGFGLNAALGVVVAFFVIYGWLWAMLPRFKANELIKFTPEYAFWGRFMEWCYTFTKRSERGIVVVALGLLALCFWGISRIHTNYRVEKNLPIGQQITADFLYFERKFSGFRPIEVAVFAQNGHQADDPEVLREMDKLEAKIRTYPAVKTLLSVNDVYRSLNAMRFGNKPEAYRLPDSLYEFEKMKRIADKLPDGTANVLLSKDGQKARMTGRIQDIGSDSILAMQHEIEHWWNTSTDSTVVKFKMTGTGLILDKNAMYIRDNMLQGLIPSVLIVALIMAFLFKDWRMVLVFCVPNVLPLFMAGALIGFGGIALDAATATIFSIIFGIATDDTIHFLSTFKLSRSRGQTVEQALHTTLLETGKAMCLSSIILFFAFLVMLFSIHPPSVTVGLLVSVTLAGALFCDLLLAPILVRRLVPEGSPVKVVLKES